MYKIFINHSSIDIAEEYEVENYYSVKELKNLILKKHNYSNMKLIFSGKILKDDYTLEHYDICEENMIICMGKMFMNNTPNISSIRENPPIRPPNNPNNNTNIYPSTNIPQLNTNNQDNLRFTANNNTSSNTSQSRQNNMGSITVHVPINPFLNLTNILSSITTNNGSLTNNNNTNNFMQFFSSNLNNDPYIASLTSRINNNPFFNILNSQINNQHNLSSITGNEEFRNFFSQIGSITNIHSNSNNDNINNFADSFINNLNRNINNLNRNTNNDLFSSILNNPFLNSFTQQNQNIDLNRPINDNDYQIYASGIEQLRNMGFYNNIHNINSLKYTNNNIDEAVNILINHV